MRISCRAVDKVMNNLGNTLGYILEDNNGNRIQMQSSDIKKKINSRELSVYNLEITKDNRLIHNPKNDRYGLTVPPHIFFLGEHKGWNVAYSGTTIMVIKNSRTGRIGLRFEAKLYNDNRAWFVRQISDDPVLLGFDYTTVVYRDWPGSFEKWIEDIENAYETKRVTKEELEIKALKNYREELNRRASYEDDYRNGHSEDREKAYHSLKYLDSKREWYEANKHKLDSGYVPGSSNNKDKKSGYKLPEKFIKLCKQRADTVEQKSERQIYLESASRGGNLYDPGQAYVSIGPNGIYCKVSNCRGKTDSRTFKTNESRELVSYLENYDVFVK